MTGRIWSWNGEDIACIELRWKKPLGRCTFHRPRRKWDTDIYLRNAGY